MVYYYQTTQTTKDNENLFQQHDRFCHKTDQNSTILSQRIIQKEGVIYHYFEVNNFTKHDINSKERQCHPAVLGPKIQ